jgi:hypothetical protein
MKLRRSFSIWKRSRLDHECDPQQRLGKEIALGYVKRGFNNPATKLEALSSDAAEAIPVEVVSLPFL